MCRYLFRTYKWLISLFFIALMMAGCSVTPTDSSAEEMAMDAGDEPAMEVESTVDEPVVYEVDGAEDVEVASLPTPPEQNAATLKASAPEQYVVQKGDTLWDLSNKFLNQPWYWPEIWYMNPQVNNPHLIYPGDVINVFYVGGRPYLTVGDSPRIAGAERLSPEMRGEAIDINDRVIPIQAIEQFLIRPQIVSKDELEQSPHIVGARDNRLIYGAGDNVYVRGSEEFAEGEVFNIYRAGEEFVDPKTGEILGYQAIHLGDGELIKEGEVGTISLNSSEREILRGDRILPLIDEADSAFYPRPPNASVDGEVIYLFDAISQVGTYQIVAMNVGTQDGIEKGNIVAIAQAGRAVTDPFAKREQGKIVQLPHEDSGVAMVFRIFERVSYAFIMNANRPIRVGDIVRNPE